MVPIADSVQRECHSYIWSQNQTSKRTKAYPDSEDRDSHEKGLADFSTCLACCTHTYLAVQSENLFPRIVVFLAIYFLLTKSVSD